MISTYVALVCEIKGLEGRATGASISIDMMKVKSLGFVSSGFQDI